jgi:hypothetical protein
VAHNFIRISLKFDSETNRENGREKFNLNTNSIPLIVEREANSEKSEANQEHGSQ